MKQLKEASQHPLLLLLVGSVLSSLLIPGISSRSSEAQLLQETRLKKALEVGTRNREFDSKLNVLSTLMQTFHNQNVRMKFNSGELKEAQTAFRKQYTDRYLELDEMAWWWYGDIEREAHLLKLTSAEDYKLLDETIKKYNESVATTVEAIGPMWRYLSSSDYSLDDAKQKHFEQLKETMNQEIGKQHAVRGNLVQDIAKIFAAVK